MNFRRWLFLTALLAAGAIFLSLEGWRLLERSEWLQNYVQQQFAAKFGETLKYQRLKANLAGVHLSQVTYEPPGGAIAISIEEISVTFRLRDLLKRLLQKRSSPRMASVGLAPADSLASPSLAGYQLHVSIKSPRVILRGNWEERLKNWMRLQSELSSSPASSHPVQLFRHSQPQSGPPSDSVPASFNVNARGREWNFDFLKKLDVRDGKILWDLPDGREPILLADEIEGNLDPALLTKHKAKSEAQISGKLLAASDYNFFIRALIDMKSGGIDSINIALHELSLQRFDDLWKLRQGVVSAGDEKAAMHDSMATREPFYKTWKINGGVLNGRFLVSPKSSKLQGEGNDSVKAAIARGLVSTAAKSIADLQVSGELQIRGGRLQFGEYNPITIGAIDGDARIKAGVLEWHSRQLLNQQAVQLAGTMRFNRLFRPELDLAVTSDSLMAAEFLFPFLQAGQNIAEHSGDAAAANSRERFPIRGWFSLRGRIAGSLAAPSLEAKIFSPVLSIGSQQVQRLSAHLRYTLPLRGGAADSSIKLVAGSGELDGLQLKSWGELNLRHSQRPLDLNVVANGEITPVVLNLMGKNQTEPSAALPRFNATVTAKIDGPLQTPKAAGQFTLNVLHKANTAKILTDLPLLERGRFLGRFTLHQDTLRIEASIDSLAKSSPARQTARHDSEMPLVELRGEISGFFAHKARLSMQRPLFKLHGRGVQWLPAILGKALPADIVSNLVFDTYLDGHADSVNIQIEGRHKAAGYTLFQLFGYLRSFGTNRRLISGDLKLFPGAHNEIAASYSADWQDSVFYVTDLRAENWLAGGLEIATTGNHEIQGNLKINKAKLSRLVEGVARELPKYDGNLFGEIRLAGTLSAPYADGDFWILEARFNGVGNFSLSSKARLDGRGWQISNVEVRKNDQLFLKGAVSYQRATREPRLELRGQDVDLSEFLGAVAGVSPGIATGRMTFDLKTESAVRAPDGSMRLPLRGLVKLQNGRVVWFAFDEIAMNMDGAPKPDRSYSYLSKNGIFFHQARYEKTGAFALEGDAYLPFNLETPVELSLSGNGNFLAVLPDLTSFFQQTASSGHLDLNVVGPYKNLTLRNSYFRFKDGFLKMSKVARAAHDIVGEAFVDNRGTFISIPKLEGKIGDAALQLRTQESPPELLATAANGALPIYHPLRLGKSPLHFGTILVKSTDNGVLVNVPGLMERGEVGRFAIAGQNGLDEFMITGPWAHPLFKGRLALEGVDFMFPFDENAEPADSLLRKILLNSDWDVVVESRKDNRYVQKMPTAIDKVYVNFGIDDALSRLHFTGILQDSTFRTEGALISTRGTVEYLDLNFRVEKFGAEFDKSDWLPIVYGRAWTTLTDSTNFPYHVYLTLHTIDTLTREEVERGRFQNAYFKLSSDRPGSVLENTQQQILAALGYSLDNVRAKATEAVGISTDNLVFRPLIRPVERQLERHLGLDVVRLSSRFTRNFLVANFNNDTASRLASPAPDENHKENAALAMLQSTRLLVGKYLWSDLYLNYIGQVEVGPDETLATTLKPRPLLRHTLGLEYRINPAMMLQFEYDYNPLLINNREDSRIWLRHSFPVDFGGKPEEKKE
jgi:hypothetical protein